MKTQCICYARYQKYIDKTCTYNKELVKNPKPGPSTWNQNKLITEM